MEVQMSSRRKVKTQMLIKETFYKTFRNLKSFLLEGFQKLSKTPRENPIFSSSNKINNFTENWDSKVVVKKKEGLLSSKEQTKDDEQCGKSSMKLADQSRLEGLKEEKKASEYSAVKQEGSSFVAADALAHKMKELEMMDVNDEDHVLDLQEVLHYYSLLTCPAYLELVDKFFLDMYFEFQLPQPSRSVNNSMRKLGSATTSVHGSTRNLGSASVHSSMRSLGPLKL